MVSGRGARRSEEHADPGVGANRQPAGSTQGSRLFPAYLFGAVCPSEGKAAALIMPICNTAAMNHHLSEISSQIAVDAQGHPQPLARGPRVSRWYDPAVADNVEQVGKGQSRAASSGVAFDYQRGPHPGCDLPVNPRIERAFEDRGRMPIHNNCREGACDFFLVYCAAEPVPAKP